MKPVVAVIFGGASVEHEISVISAVQAMHSINREKYDILPVYITKSGEMYSGDELFDIDAFKNTAQLIGKLCRVSIIREDGRVFVKYGEKKLFSARKKTAVDVAFPIVHGTNCEDGTLAGFLQLLDIPYVGCDVLSSAIGMDKVVFKSILHTAALPYLPWCSFSSRRFVTEPDAVISEIEQKLGYPVIIKPANLGSSVGITKAKDSAELREAVKLAASFAEKILAERAILNLREINCSVLGDVSSCEASVLEEPVMRDEILSYNDKYKSGGKSKGMASLSRRIPADLPMEKAAEICDIARRTFTAIGASGVARIDFLLDGDDGDKVYVNEINTIPGSLSFYLWEPTGLPYTELIDRLIELAFKHHRARRELMFTIDTDVLSGGGFKFGKGGSKI